MASLARNHGHVPQARPIAAKEVPLVDRTEEMDVLKEALYGAVHSEGGLVFIHGEAGIGKTRLLRELGTYARSRGVQVLYGRCPALFRMDGVPPYILWKEVIKDYLETCSPERLNRVIGFYPAEVAKLVPELSQKLRAFPQSFSISPEQEQNRLFEAVSQFITNISQEAPLLVVLDDLQWTDPSSLLLLHYLARGVQKTQLLLLGAYRSTDIDAKHPLTPVLTELNRERLPQSFSLKRMSLEDTSEIIKNILEQDDVPPHFCRLVYEKTKGNPFFAEEVIRSLKEEEVIYREANTWKFQGIPTIEFPETVRNVLKARLKRLDEECQQVLTLASFIGNDFTCEALSGVSGIEEDKLLELIEKLLKTDLVKHRVIRGEDMCSFADVLVRDVVYEEVSPFRRRKLHNTVGSALEKVYAGKIDEHFGELALHFLEGGDKDKALDYFLKAGERAQKIYANTEAASYFQSALRLLEEKEGDLREKGRVLESLGDAKSLVDDFEGCVKYWSEALPLWIKLQEKGKTATLHRKIANVLWNSIGDKKKATEHHGAALRILETEPESAELARLYEDVAHMLRRKGQVTEALPWAEKALRLAEKLNALEAVAVSCIELAMLAAWQGEVDKGLEYANRALRIALDNDYLETALMAYDKAGGMLPMEEYEKRLDYWEKGLALAKKTGSIGLYAYFLEGPALEYTLRGELSRALHFGEESVALARKANDPFTISWNLLILGEIYQRLGEWEKSEQLYEEAMSIPCSQDEFFGKAWSLQRLAMLHADREEYTKARGLLEETVKMAETADIEGWVVDLSVLLAWMLVELGETEEAQELLDKRQRFDLGTKREWRRIEVMPYRAMLLRAQKKYAESIALFEETLEAWESIKADFWYAYWFARQVLCEYARACLERSETGDRIRAGQLLNRALEMFRKMGARKDIEKVEATLLSLETGKPASAPKPKTLVTTGHVDLDNLLCGGIPPDYAVVLTSPSCDERDLLVKGFLETGARNGEVTFYVTIDASAAKALAESNLDLQLFVCNPEADAVIKDSPNVFKMKGVENLTDISIALTSAIRRLDPSAKGSRRICIGLLSDVLLQHHAVETRRWLTALMTKLKSEGFTTLAVVDPQIHPPEELRATAGLFEGEINIRERETEKGTARFLKIRRISGQKYVDDELLLSRETPK